MAMAFHPGKVLTLISPVQAGKSRVQSRAPTKIKRVRRLHTPRPNCRVRDAELCCLLVFSYVGKWEVEEPTKYPGIPGDKGLVAKSPAAHHAISALFDTPYVPEANKVS